LKHSRATLKNFKFKMLRMSQFKLKTKSLNSLLLIINHFALDLKKI
jgi:hypothetical protein